MRPPAQDRQHQGDDPGKPWILRHRGNRWRFPTHRTASIYAQRKCMLFYSINYEV